MKEMEKAEGEAKRGATCADLQTGGSAAIQALREGAVPGQSALECFPKPGPARQRGEEACQSSGWDGSPGRGQNTVPTARRSAESVAVGRDRKRIPKARPPV